MKIRVVDTNNNYLTFLELPMIPPEGTFLWLGDTSEYWKVTGVVWSIKNHNTQISRAVITLIVEK